MKITVLVSRLLLGFLYLVFGLDYFLHFILINRRSIRGLQDYLKRASWRQAIFIPCKKSFK